MLPSPKIYATGQQPSPLKPIRLQASPAHAIMTSELATWTKVRLPLLRYGKLLVSKGLGKLRGRTLKTLTCAFDRAARQTAIFSGTTLRYHSLRIPSSHNSWSDRRFLTQYFVLRRKDKRNHYTYEKVQIIRLPRKRYVPNFFNC